MASFTTEHTGWEILADMGRRLTVTLEGGTTVTGRPEWLPYSLEITYAYGTSRRFVSGGVELARRTETGLLFNDRVVMVATAGAGVADGHGVAMALAM